jgi:plasmid stabilization system protein ParE
LDEVERSGLGTVFAAAVDATFTAHLQNPLAYPSVKGDTQRALVRRFPYAVYFRPLDNEIIVLAVMHGRRSPRQRRSRR